jgi:hypothetical protein
MLPTAPEKVEHFLSAYLGLSDKRRWAIKVEAKLFSAKAAIAQVNGRLGRSKEKERRQGRPASAGSKG